MGKKNCTESQREKICFIIITFLTCFCISSFVGYSLNSVKKSLFGFVCIQFKFCPGIITELNYCHLCKKKMCSLLKFHPAYKQKGIGTVKNNDSLLTLLHP